MTESVDAIIDMAQALSQGQFEQRFQQQFQGELGELASYLEAVRQTLQSLSTSADGSIDLLPKAADGVAEINREAESGCNSVWEVVEQMHSDQALTSQKYYRRKVMFNPDRDVSIVDDASAMRRIVRGLLKEIGFKNLRDAENGQLALEELQNKKADFVVSDWNIPVRTGIELLKAIRADEGLKSTPVLMVTAQAKQENIVEAVQASVNNYIVKPFNAATLQEKLNKIFP